MGYFCQMKKLILFFLILFTFTTNHLQAQKIVVLDSNGHISLRGLSVVNDKVIWASGSDGSIAISTNGGKSFTWKTVKGFEKTDFRDIEAFDKKTAVIMGVGSPAYILRTDDAGNTWKKVYENNDTSMFLDAMEFWNDMSGIVIGDPIEGKFFIGRTFDGGKTWQTIPQKNEPVAVDGEACFAASGTNIRKLTRDEAVFVSGGIQSNFFKRNQKFRLPILQGSSTTGANSIAIHKNIMIVVGGDFTKPAGTTGNCAISEDGGITWKSPTTPPFGYRSCVEYIGGNKWITCGINGVDISDDNGSNWRNISNHSFNTVIKSKKGKDIFLVGSKGRIARVEQ